MKPASTHRRPTILEYQLLDSESGDEKESKDIGKGMKWVLPGLQERPKAQETEESSSLFCPGNFSLTAESLGLESGASSSYESNRGRLVLHFAEALNSGKFQ
ncbi:hypothetical protein Droror1_Dr00027897 [Drosera rotundifolia]